MREGNLPVGDLGALNIPCLGRDAPFGLTPGMPDLPLAKMLVGLVPPERLGD